MSKVFQKVTANQLDFGDTTLASTTNGLTVTGPILFENGITTTGVRTQDRVLVTNVDRISTAIQSGGIVNIESRTGTSGNITSISGTTVNWTNPAIYQSAANTQSATYTDAAYSEVVAKNSGYGAIVNNANVVHYTNDYGATWSDTNNCGLNAICVNTSANGSIMVVGDTGVYRISTDGGSSWSAIGGITVSRDNPTNVKQSIAISANGQYIAIAAGQLCYLSTNSGTSFSQAVDFGSAIDTKATMSQSGDTICFASNLERYISTNSGSSFGTVLSHTNAGYMLGLSMSTNALAPYDIFINGNASNAYSNDGGATVTNYVPTATIYRATLGPLPGTVGNLITFDTANGVSYVSNYTTFTPVSWDNQPTVFNSLATINISPDGEWLLYHNPINGDVITWQNIIYAPSIGDIFAISNSRYNDGIYITQTVGSGTATIVTTRSDILNFNKTSLTTDATTSGNIYGITISTASMVGGVLNTTYGSTSAAITASDVDIVTQTDLTSTQLTVSNINTGLTSNSHYHIGVGTTSATDQTTGFVTTLSSTRQHTITDITSNVITFTDGGSLTSDTNITIAPSTNQQSGPSIITSIAVAENYTVYTRNATTDQYITPTSGGWQTALSTYQENSVIAVSNTGQYQIWRTSSTTYVSNNGGATNISNTTSGTATYPGVACSDSGQYMVMCSDTGAWVSSDYGDNWTQLISGAAVHKCGMSLDGSFMIFANATQHWISTDSGATTGGVVVHTSIGNVNNIAVSKNTTGSWDVALCGVTQLAYSPDSGATIVYRNGECKAAALGRATGSIGNMFISSGTEVHYITNYTTLASQAIAQTLTSTTTVLGMGVTSTLSRLVYYTDTANSRAYQLTPTNYLFNVNDIVEVNDTGLKVNDGYCYVLSSTLSSVTINTNAVADADFLLLGLSNTTGGGTISAVKIQTLESEAGVWSYKSGSTPSAVVSSKETLATGEQIATAIAGPLAPSALRVRDRAVVIKSDTATATASSGGIVNIDTKSASATVNITTITGGNTVTWASGTPFSAGDIVEISDAAVLDNNGLYVLSTAGAGTATIVATNSDVLNFNKTTLTNDASASGTMTLVSISKLDALNGTWRVASGSTSSALATVYELVAPSLLTYVQPETVNTTGSHLVVNHNSSSVTPIKGGLINIDTKSTTKTSAVGGIADSRALTAYFSPTGVELGEVVGVGGGASAYFSVHESYIAYAQTGSTTVRYSTDDGVTWQNQTGALQISTFRMFYTSATGQYQIIFNNSANAWVSNDYGASWTDTTRQANTSSDMNCTTMSDDGKYMVIPSTSGCWLSSDYGVNFTQVSGTYSTFWCVSRDGKVIVLAVDSVSAKVSTDYGASFSTVGWSTTPGFIFGAAISRNASGTYDILITGNGGLAYSNDSGTTFTYNAATVARAALSGSPGHVGNIIVANGSTVSYVTSYSTFAVTGLADQIAGATNMVGLFISSNKAIAYNKPNGKIILYNLSLFQSGDIMEITDAATVENNGLYSIDLAFAGSVALTRYGSSTTVVDDATVAGTVANVSISVMDALAGKWRTSSGATLTEIDTSVSEVNVPRVPIVATNNTSLVGVTNPSNMYILDTSSNTVELTLGSSIPSGTRIMAVRKGANTATIVTSGVTNTFDNGNASTITMSANSDKVELVYYDDGSFKTYYVI